MSVLHLISWNVNGIRAIMKKDFLKNIKLLNPDILCLQETKAGLEDTKIALSLLPDYHVFVNDSKARKGYSGTALLSKTKPLEVYNDIGVLEHDQEGRVITAEYDQYFVVTVYVPNSGRELARLDYRQTWDDAFLKYLKDLEKKKPVIACGDFNVAHKEIDLARPKANYNVTAGYTQQEIDGFTNLINEGFVDTFRYLHGDDIKYSYFSYRFNARKNKVGWRIDYFLVSESILKAVRESDISNEYEGSDHCPAAMKLDTNGVSA